MTLRVLAQRYTNSARLSRIGAIAAARHTRSASPTLTQPQLQRRQRWAEKALIADCDADVLLDNRQCAS